MPPLVPKIGHTELNTESSHPPVLEFGLDLGETSFEGFVYDLRVVPSNNF